MPNISLRPRWSTALTFLSLASACAAPMVSTLDRPPAPQDLAALWVSPGEQLVKDVVNGPGGAAEAPRPDVVYTIIEDKHGGFSPKVEVVDPSGRKWSVKMGPEAQAEVTTSRIVWLAGYHQPPNYYLEHWQASRDGKVHQMGPGRFRPHLEWIKSRGHWAWHANPFVGSRPFRGLIALMMVVNSTDLKDDNNEVYHVRGPAGRSEQWYAVRDLGASLGETGHYRPRRNNVGLFEKQAFITGVDGDRVMFEFHGKYQELLRQVTPADVRWMCEQLDRVTPAQWRDAFRAGGYDEATTARYLAKIESKIRQGLSVAGGAAR